MKLRVKYGLLFSLLLTIFVVLAIVLIGIDADKAIRNEQYEKVAVLGEAIANEIANHFLNGRFFTVTEIIKSYQKRLDYIKYVFVIDSGGKIVAHTFVEGFPAELINMNPLSFKQKKSSILLSTEKGLLSDNAFHLLQGMDAELHIGVSEKYVQQLRARTNRKIMGTGIIFVLIGWAVSMILSYEITKPISKIVKGMKMIGSGNLDYTIEISTKDEIGMLADSFNTMAAMRKQTEAEREKLIADLQGAIANVKLLSGFLPICASCKKIRDDNGYWNQIEAYYISEHSEALFTHAICPECAKVLYPEQYDEVWGEEKKSKEKWPNGKKFYRSD